MATTTATTTNVLTNDGYWLRSRTVVFSHDVCDDVSDDVCDDVSDDVCHDVCDDVCDDVCIDECNSAYEPDEDEDVGLPSYYIPPDILAKFQQTTDPNYQKHCFMRYMNHLLNIEYPVIEEQKDRAIHVDKIFSFILDVFDWFTANYSMSDSREGRLIHVIYAKAAELRREIRREIFEQNDKPFSNMFPSKYIRKYPEFHKVWNTTSVVEYLLKERFLRFQTRCCFSSRCETPF